MDEWTKTAWREWRRGPCAAGAAAVAVMRACRGTLKGARRPLLECALVLCGDPWPQVSDPTRRALSALQDQGEGNFTSNHIRSFAHYTLIIRSLYAHYSLIRST